MDMLANWLQSSARGRSTTALFAHWGAAGLFFFAIVDSSPLPTLGGTDILTIFLAATRPHPWYEFAAAATAGSVIGAYITFRLAHRAGRAYLDGKLAKKQLSRVLQIFDQWGTGALIASTAIPFPFPTGLLFAAAGASGQYTSRAFLMMVTVCRAVRYSVLALIAHIYGRHIIRVLRHPMQYWHWLLLFALVFIGLMLSGVLVNRRFAEANP
jgi:membrane protein YqaA with SNARE-associated domain